MDNLEKTKEDFLLEIQELKQEIESLKISEQKFHVLFKTLPVGVTLADVNGNIIESNNAAECILGLSSSEQEQRAIDGHEWTIIRPDGSLMPSEEYASVRALKEGKAIYNIEMGVTKALNEIAWINVNAAPIPDFGVAISYIDITEHKQAEMHIQHLIRMYASLSEINQTIVRVKDRDELFRNICSVTAGFGKFGLSWIGLVDNETGQVTPVVVHGAVQDKLPFEVINVKQSPFKDGMIGIAVKSGNITYCRDIQTDANMKQWREMAIAGGYHSAIAIPFHLNGEIVGILNLYTAEKDFVTDKEMHNLFEETGQDISFALNTMKVETERKQAVQELIIANKELHFQNEEKEKRAAELIIANKELVFQNQEKVKRAAELITANKELVFQNEEKEKRAAELIIANKELAFQNEEKEKRAAELIIANKELTFQNEEKEKRAAELIIANKELTFQNEEKEKRAAELIIAKLHAEESDRLKSAFLCNMSHEIRTPMNGILGFAGLLKTPELTGEKQQEYIQIIEKSGARMLNIINDIVDISKIEAGLMKLTISESYINAQIEYIYTFFKPAVEAKGMKLSFSNSLPAKEAIINTDREKLYAILTNLVKNAIKYTDKGSIEFGYNLKVVAEHVEAVAGSDNQQSRSAELEFYVKDTGIGIPKDRQQAIFERFIQADIGDSRAFQGAGLGLSIAKSYIEMLGGRIWVESEEGIGSIFYFTLPYNSIPKEKPIIKNSITADAEKAWIKKLNILIVEDDEVSQLFLSTALSQFENKVFKVDNGQKAVEIFQDNADIDLVLMDIKMPGINGFEATRQIRELNKDVVIVAQTGYGLSGDRVEAIEAGCNDYITKPINLVALTGIIHKHFKT